MNTIADTPDRPRRTKFDRWLWERDMTNADAGRELGCAAETVRRYRLPISAGGRIPHRGMMAKIHRLTDGVIGPSDFYPEALSLSPEVAR